MSSMQIAIAILFCTRSNKLWRNSICRVTSNGKLKPDVIELSFDVSKFGKPIVIIESNLKAWTPLTSFLELN